MFEETEKEFKKKNVKRKNVEIEMSDDDPFAFDGEEQEDDPFAETEAEGKLCVLS